MSLPGGITLRPDMANVHETASEAPSNAWWMRLPDRIKAKAMTSDSRIIKFGTTSWYCAICLHGKYCDSWDTHSFAYTSSTETDGENVKAKTVEKSTQQQSSTDTKANTNDFVSAVYETDWYIGQIVGVDKTDNEVEVKFMTKSKILKADGHNVRIDFGYNLVIFCVQFSLLRHQENLKGCSVYRQRKKQNWTFVKKIEEKHS